MSLVSCGSDVDSSHVLLWRVKLYVACYFRYLIIYLIEKLKTQHCIKNGGREEYLNFKREEEEEEADAVAGK
jgi:hypothetical protein